MTFDKIPPPQPPKALPPSQAQALWKLVASMTRWEDLSFGAAADRVRQADSRLGMSAQIGDPPWFPNLPPGPETFVQALSILREASHPTRMLALQGALEVALGSGTLPLVQNHALQTVVDALNLQSGEWTELMAARTGAEPPEPWDPSLKAAWLGREGDGPGPAGAWDDAGPHPGPVAQTAEDRIARIKALAMLGLDEGALEGDIKRAFHRVSRVHHPDRYASLGPEAALEADQAFRRIKGAYEFLLKAGT